MQHVQPHHTTPSSIGCNTVEHGVVTNSKNGSRNNGDDDDDNGSDGNV